MKYADRAVEKRVAVCPECDSAMAEQCITLGGMIYYLYKCECGYRHWLNAAEQNDLFFDA